MKQFRSILSLTFALLVMLSSSSYMVGVHLCGGKVQDIALLTKAEVCEKEQKLPPCHKPTSKPCCEDHAVIHEGDDFSGSLSDITLGPSIGTDIISPAVLIAEVIPNAAVCRTNFREYTPPPRPPADLTISLRVFLI